MKLTKRKAFKFYRSYYDVYNELSDKEKVLFMDAILDRQFLGVKPDHLTGMVKFAYISQVNSIDSQVKGYEDKTGDILTPSAPPSQGAMQPPSVPPSVQEKEKEKEKVKEDFDTFWKLYDKSTDKAKALKKWKSLKDDERTKCLKVVSDYVKSTPDKKYRKNCITWLRGSCWNDEIEVPKDPVKTDAAGAPLTGSIPNTIDLFK